MNIVIGADMVPTKPNEDLFKIGAAEKLVGEEILALLKAADIAVVNLEMPLTDTDSPIEKCGQNLRAPQAAINGYTAANIGLVTLANNHILDYGEKGLRDTFKVLEQNGIAYFGAGETPQEAARPYVFECEGKRIGFYACAEHEFSIVSESAAGANPFDPLESLDHISALKKQCDYVIVLYHGGKEHYRYPSPNLQKVCRKIVDKGADLVVCQHSHCIGCKEERNGGTIVYGQGNFLFDHPEGEFWQTSLLIQIQDDFKISYIPLVKQNETVRVAKGEKAEEILSCFQNRSAEILQEGAVEKLYAEFAQTMLNNYLYRVSGKRSFLFRVCNKLTGYRLSKWLLERKYGLRELLALQNTVECEAHCELFLKAIEVDEQKRRR